jgi:hypothetical protein
MDRQIAVPPEAPMPWMKIEIPEEQARSFWSLLGPQFGSVIKPIATSLSSDKAAIYGNGG